MDQHILLHTAKFLADSSRGLLHIPSGREARALLAQAQIHGSHDHRMRFTEHVLQTDSIDKSVSGALVDVETLTYISTEIAADRLKLRRMLLGVDLTESEAHLGDIQGRLRNWLSLGARFANWTVHLPARVNTDIILDRCEEAACFAAACEIEGLVPVLSLGMGAGADEGALDETITELFSACDSQGVYYPGLLLRVPMQAGDKVLTPPLHASVPQGLGGIFIDQRDRSTESFYVKLSCINPETLPWHVTACLSTGFLSELLQAWDGPDTRSSGSAHVKPMESLQKILAS